jgi:RNA polymerase sigma factor (TIGR02999 family)
MSSGERDITLLLNRAALGDATASREVFDTIYSELRRIASARGSALPAGATLQTTALVHEAYLRIVGRHPAGWENMRHFYFTAARAMRDIVVEDARRKGAAKRGSGIKAESLEGLEITLGQPASEILAIDDALASLEREDFEGHRIVLLRFFTGLTVPEIAEAMEVSVSTIERKWRFLRAWLAERLESSAI